MSGTSVVSIFEKNGQYLSRTVKTAAITLGQCVALDTANAESVLIGTSALKTVSLGVAVSARRFSRTAIDNEVAVDELVTVLTSGIANVTASGTITRGDYVELANAGRVATHTPGSTNHSDVFALALSNATDGNTVQILLRRG